MKKFPFYTLLFAVYPILSLYSHNISEVDFGYAVRPILVSILIVGLFYLFSFLITRSRNRSALISSLSFLLFSSYGLIFLGIKGSESLALLVGRQRIFLPAYILASAGIIFLLSRIQDKTPNFNFGMNLIGLVLIGMPIFNILSHPKNVFQSSNPNPTGNSIQQDNNNLSPDIYYFVLDGYGRSDYLQQYMKYDNSGFLQQLKDRGFFIGDCSLSNYSFTRLSLASSLNMNYLENLPGKFDPSSTDSSLLDDLIHHSLVRQTLEKNGYQTVAFESGYQFTELSDARYYFKPNAIPLFMKVLSPLEIMAANDSMLVGLKYFSEFQPLLSKIFPYYEKYQREQYIITQLKKVPEIPGKKFVFIHMVTTHRPYIFQPNGDVLLDDKYYSNDGVPVNDNYYIRGYQYQVEFTNSYLLDLIDLIIKKSNTPPVIILQGDHGVRIPGRLSILNAIYYQGKDLQLSSSISPVNTFRVIFDRLGLGTFDILPDRSYYSNANKSPYLLVEPNDNSSNCSIQ